MGALTTAYTPPTFNLNISLWGSAGSPSWDTWDRHGLPMGIDIDLAVLCPELPAAITDGVRL